MTIIFVLAAATPGHARIAGSMVIDQATGQVLHSYNPDRQWAPASLTKLMTLYMVFEALEAGDIQLNTRWRVSRHAAGRQPSKLYLRAGTRVTVEQMILGMTVRSANDAAAVAAEGLAGTESAFGRRMTQRARELGMRNTTFRNASGLPAGGQRTTPRDMGILAHALFRDFPQYYHYFSRRHFRFGSRTYRSTHRLVRRHQGIDGLKTGYTRRARYNLITTAEQDGQRIAIVVLGASSSNERYAYTRSVMATMWGGIPSQRGTMVAEAAANQDEEESASADAGESSETQTETQTASRESDEGERRLELSGRAAAAEREEADEPAESESSTGRNAIQVGTYREFAPAQRAALRARAALPNDYLQNVRLIVSTRQGRTGRFYRARILGLEGDRGSRACRILKRNDIDCITIRHDAPARRIQAAAATAQESRGDSEARAEGRDEAESSVESGEYAIQTGAYQYLGDAQRGARRASRLLPERYREATRRAILNRHRGYYRVRFIGLSRQDAAEACRIMRERHGRCVALRHERQSASRSSGGRYAIQVGAFRHMRSARRAARRARNLLPSAYHTRMVILRRHRGYYRVRYIDMSRSRAVRACRVLRRRGNDCVALRHR